MEIPSGAPSKLSLFKYVGVPALVAAIGFVSFNGVFFYNEAGFATHVRTIFGEEKIVDDVGYATKWFGRATPWKKALSVQSVLTEALEIDDSSDNDSLGATIEAFPIVFLGNVDAKVESSARFRLPSGEQFLKIAQEYRNPENFIKTALVPAIKETLQATASLMSADDFYAGARSEFAAEFENQLNDGLYLIQRKEIRGPRGHLPSQTAILQAGTEQGNFGDNNASQFVTEKVMDSKGIPVRKQQQFRKYGVEVVEARITNVDPNPQYKQRMVKVQQALAELAVARQNRLKEEEEKLLVTARGEKEVEARRQETLRDQIEQTTQAETEKQLAVINAEREKQRAEIEKQTAELLRDKASITAQATKITADAEAYARKAVIEADGALQPKLDALVQINKVWAEAASQAPVPGVMMGGSGNGASASRQDEIGQLSTELDRIESRVRRLNALGFDVAELDITTSADGSRVRIQPKVVDAGHHTRRLLRLTGLDVEENQARRLLNDLDTFRFRTNQQGVDEALVAHQWLTQSFEPVVTAVPAHLRGKRDAAQIFHEVLDYRWYASQRENRDVPLIDATHGYVRDVLEGLPDEAMNSRPLSEGSRQLANPFDPSQGYLDEDGAMPDDPWELEAEDVPEPTGVLDIAALRRGKG